MMLQFECIAQTLVLHCSQVMTALSVAKEALQRREASQPSRLAQRAAKEGKTIFTIPEVGCAK